MKALVLTGPGGLQQVQVQELPEPTIQSPDQVLLRVQAIALNRLDLFVAQGLPGITYRFPHVVGCDAAGTVQAVGSAVHQVRPGDRVMVNPTLSCGQCPGLPGRRRVALRDGTECWGSMSPELLPSTSSCRPRTWPGFLRRCPGPRPRPFHSLL